MIFILIVLIGIILIVLNVMTLKKENKNFNGILNNKEKNLTDVQLQIGALRKEFGETIFEIQCDLKELREENSFLRSELLKSNGKYFDNRKELNIEEHHNIDNGKSLKLQCKDKEKLDSLSDDKVDKIKRLLDEGLTVDELCKKTSIGKGEVLLIKRLYKK